MTTDVIHLAKKLNNFTLKQWLRDVGPVRRKEILKKIKIELEDLGLPKTKLRHGLRHGLIQLMTECSVTIERLPSNYALEYNTGDFETCAKENDTSYDENETSEGEVADLRSSSKKTSISFNNSRLLPSTKCLVDKLHFLTEINVPSNTQSLSCDKLFLLETVPTRPNDQTNCSVNSQKGFSDNSSLSIFNENLPFKDILFKTPSVPSVNNSISEREVSAKGTFSQGFQESLESNSQDCTKSKSVCQLSKESSPMKDSVKNFRDNSLVSESVSRKLSSIEPNSSSQRRKESKVLLSSKDLSMDKYTSSTKKVCPLAEMPIIQLKDINVPLGEMQKSLQQSEYNYHKRRFSSDNTSSTSRKNPSKVQRSFSCDENSLRNIDIIYSEKENLKEESHSDKEQYKTKNRNLIMKSTETRIHSSLDKKVSCSSDKKSSSICQSTLSNVGTNSKQSDPPEKPIMASDSQNCLKIALPVKIQLDAIMLNDISKQILFSQKSTSDSENRISNLKTKALDTGLNASDEEKNTAEGTFGGEKRKILENEEINGKVSKLDESVETEKIKKKSISKRKQLKSLFQELFGDDEDETENKNQNLNNCEQKRRKVDSRDSCDSGAYGSEASPILVMTYSKDLDPSEIFSPDSTGIECKRKETDINLPAEFPSLSAEICHSLELKRVDPKDKIPLESDLNLSQKEDLVSYQERSSPEMEEESDHDESVLPDSSTCISDDELTIVECEPTNESTVSEENEKIENPTKSPPDLLNSSSGPSDDVLSKAGILRDQERDSYIFSSDDINILLNILSENPQNSERLATETSLGSASQRQETDLDKSVILETQSENKTQEVSKPSEKPVLDDDEIQIILEKRPLTFNILYSTTVKPVQTEENQVEEVEIIENNKSPPVQRFVPRLRVKNPSELGCRKWCSTPLPLSDPSTLQIPSPDPVLLNPEINADYSPLTEPIPCCTNSLSSQIQPYMTPAFPTPGRSIPLPPPPPYRETANSNSNILGPNQVVSVALSAAQKLISLINPLTAPNSGPQLSHYYNSLINILGDIAHDTAVLRNFYRNRPFGLCSPDLLGFNLLLNGKLQSLSKFLQVAFEEKTMQFILNNYHQLTGAPILNTEELGYIISLQYSDFNLNRPRPVQLVQPFPLLDKRSFPNSNAPSVPEIPLPGSSTPSNGPIVQLPVYQFRGFIPPISAAVAPISVQQTSRTKSSMTNEQHIILKAQIDAYNTLNLNLSRLLKIESERQLNQTSNTRREVSSTERSNAETNANLQPRNLNPNWKDSVVESEKNTRKVSAKGNTLDESKSILNLSQNSTVVFRKRSTNSEVTQVNEEIRNNLTINSFPTLTSTASNSRRNSAFTIRDLLITPVMSSFLDNSSLVFKKNSATVNRSESKTTETSTANSGSTISVPKRDSTLTRNSTIITAIPTITATVVPTIARTVVSTVATTVVPTIATTVVSTIITSMTIPTITTSVTVPTTTASITTPTITASTTIPTIITSSDSNSVPIHRNDPTITSSQNRSIITSLNQNNKLLMRNKSSVAAQPKVTSTIKVQNVILQSSLKMQDTLKMQNALKIQNSLKIQNPTKTQNEINSTRTIMIPRSKLVPVPNGATISTQKYMAPKVQLEAKGFSNLKTKEKEFRSMPSLSPTPVLEKPQKTSKTQVKTQASNPIVEKLQGDLTQASNPIVGKLQEDTTHVSNPIVEKLQEDSTQVSNPIVKKLQEDSTLSNPIVEKLQKESTLSNPIVEKLQEDSAQVSNPVLETRQNSKQVSTPQLANDNTNDFANSFTSLSEEEDLFCLRCKKRSTVVCARCVKAHYCTKYCQEKHWETIHHETCQPEEEDPSTENFSGKTKENEVLI